MLKPDAAVVNRLYYAAFHAIQAALYDRGFEATPLTVACSHSLVPEIIADGDAPRRDGRFFSQLAEPANRPTTATKNPTRTSTHFILEPASSSPTWRPCSISD